MERDEIIKGLECWGSGKPCEEKCVVLDHEGSGNCLKLTTRSAIALIKELTEENERLKAELANRPHKLIITKKEKKNDRA